MSPAIPPSTPAGPSSSPGDPCALYLSDLLPEEQAVLGRILEAERLAFVQQPAPAVGARIVARVQEQARVHAATQRRERVRVAGEGRPLWARILVASLALHAVALGVLALLAEREDRADATAPAFVGEWVPSEEPSHDGPDLSWVIATLESPKSVELPDDLLLRGQETLRVDELLLTEPQLTGPARIYDHPAEVTLAMARRRDEGLKRRTLALLGQDADGTLRAVAKGLNYIGARQRADGSFPAEGGGMQGFGSEGDGGELAPAALALLPFLGEAWCSASAGAAPHAEVVRKGIAWLRKNAFEPGGKGAGPLSEVVLSPEEAGLVALALSEDYMLSFARLAVGEAEQRRTELTELLTRLRAEPLPSAPGGLRPSPSGAWASLGRDALLRTGIAQALPGEREGIPASVLAVGRELTAATWLEAPQTLPYVALRAYTLGAGLLLTERGVDKPLFKAWGEVNLPQLLDALLPTGGVRSGPEIRGTAMVLLALQAAYRTL